MGLSNSGVIRLLRAVPVLVLSIILFQGITVADPATSEVAKSLPANLGEFRQTGPVKVWDRKAIVESFSTLDGGALYQVYWVKAEYVSPNGEKLSVDLTTFENESVAYSQFTLIRRSLHERDGSKLTMPSPPVGTASMTSNDELLFLKGVNVVMIRSSKGKDPAKPIELGRLLAESIIVNEPEVPVLVKHLPNWMAAEPEAIYLVRKEALEDAVPNQPILREIGFDGGPEGVLAEYDQAKLLIIEFTTPQFSVDNDQRIQAKIAELKAKGEPVPSAYRRVGNYSVFVFNAPDEKTANALIDQVKYEQVVQWLGEDPYLYQRLQKYFTQTSAGVLVAVLKSSGLSLLFCLVAGALIGTMLFRHRRAQRATLYSDAGGSVRLNLDDLTAPTQQRLLEAPKTQDSANS